MGDIPFDERTAIIITLRELATRKGGGRDPPKLKSARSIQPTELHEPGLSLE
jgi:hypothetical protein